MTQLTVWCVPCPECEFKETGPTGCIVAPLFHESGDKCPSCGVPVRIRIVHAGSPLSYAAPEVDHRK